MTNNDTKNPSEYAKFKQFISKFVQDDKSKENFSKDDSNTHDMGLINTSDFLDPV